MTANPVRIVLTSILTIVALFCGASVARAQPFAYVLGQRDTDPGPANRGIQILTVVNTATNTKVTGIPLGVSCVCVGSDSVAASLDGSRVYVSNFRDNTVSVVDTSTNSVIKTLAVHPFPGSLAVSPDGTRLYVSGFLGSSLGYVVHVVDTATNATLATISLNVPQSGSGMAITPDGARLYVSNQATNASNVKVIDTVSNSVIATIPVGLVPRGVDITQDGSLVYVASQESNTLSAISTATNTVVATVGVGVRPQSARVTPDGARVYVANTNTISVIDRQTNTVVGTITGTLLPRTMDFTPDGTRAFVAVDQGVLSISTAANAITGSIPFASATEGLPSAIVIPSPRPASPPSAPTTLLGLVNGSSIALAWRNTFAGGAPSSLVLDVSGSIVTSLPLGLTDTFSFAGVPAGTYALSVRATNAAGTSAASNVVTLTFPGACSGVPLPPANFQAYKVGSTIFVAWDPAASGPAPTAYVLTVTGAIVGSFPTTGRGLNGAVPPGNYGLSVAGTNACGQGAATALQVVTIP